MLLQSMNFAAEIGSLLAGWMGWVDGCFFPAYELATEMLLLGGMKRDGFQVAVLGHRAPQVVWVEEASVSLLLRSDHVRWRPRRHWLSASPHRQLASRRRRRRSRR